jgi:hypothetical protein
MTSPAKTFLLGFAVAAAPASVCAQEATPERSEGSIYACQGAGFAPPEAFGDSESHTITSGQFSCRAQTGPMAGGVLLGHVVIEWKDGTGTLLAGSGVVRKPGVVLVFQSLDYKILYQKTDGQFSGASGAGRFKYVYAGGSEAALNGATFVFVTKSARPDAFLLEATRE